MEDVADGDETYEARRTHPGGTGYTEDGHLSVLGSLRARREEVLSNSYIDLRVPRWTEPEIFVRYKPVSHAIIRRSLDLSQKSRADRKGANEVRANVDVLVAGCVGVFALLDGERFSLRPGDPRGEWTRFDADLAENLGCGNTAAEVVRSLYISEGDILSAASAIAEFSGYKEAEADEVIEGE